MENQPYMQIVVQPAEKNFRFRYESEGRLSASIQSAKSTKENPTYPVIKVNNYTGVICMRISCVTHDDPARQHPHKLSTKGVVRPSGEVWLKFNIDQSRDIKIKDIGIVFVKKPKIEESLKHRKKENIDPTKGGWDNISRPHLFDLHCVRLCFEMFACDNTGKVINRPIAHVLSIPILDKKSSGSLKIVEISTPSASVMGGDKIIILCDKVKLQEISVLFYEEDDDGNIIWKEEINHKNSTSMKVHHQYAISLQSPKYWEFDIIQPRSAFIQLVRSKDNEFSEPIPFEFVPNPQSVQLQRKKNKKLNETTNKESLNPYAAPMKKAGKSTTHTYVPNIPPENIMTGTNNKKSTIKRTTQSIRPTLNNLGNDNKENNVYMPVNNQVQNTFQPSVQPHYQRQVANPNPYNGQYNFPCTTYPNTNIPPNFYAAPIVQHQNINNQFYVEPSNNSYNHQPTLLPNMYQQQLQQPQANIYTNGQQHGGYMDHVMNLTTNNQINCISSTYNNDTNKAVEYSTHNTPAMNDNLVTNDTNISDLLKGVSDYLPEDNDMVNNLSDHFSGINLQIQ